MNRRLVALVAPFLMGFVIASALLAVAVFPTDASRELGASITRSTPSSPSWPAACEYLIRPGDNLFRIGLRYGVTYTYLASLNGIPNPDLIFAGSVLAVPCGQYASAFVSPKNCAPSEAYDVKPGDNLFRIAVNYETSIELLRAANNLYGRVLRSGRHLIVPCPGSVKYRSVPPPSATPVPTTAPTMQAAAAIISMQGNSFFPDSVTVKNGSTVVWINNDSIEHTVTSGSPGNPSGVFDSGPISPGASYSFTFNGIGIYDYYSILQPDMKGKITVTQ